MNVKYFAIACAVLILAIIVEMIRREKMTFRYSLTWLFAGVLVLLLAVYDHFLYRLSQIAGFTLPSNFIFFLSTLFVIFVSLRQTLYANEQNQRTEVMAQSLAVLEYRLKKLEKKDS